LLEVVTNICRKILVSLKSDRNNRHCTRIPMNIYEYDISPVWLVAISCNSVENEDRKTAAEARRVLIARAEFDVFIIITLDF
jgi:hypothetical protein